MKLSTAALVAMLAAVVAVFIGTFTGAIGQHPPQLRSATRPGTPRPPHPVQRRADLHHPASRAPAPSSTAPPAPASPAPASPAPAPSGAASRPASPPPPATVVSAYYAALDARRFRSAWSMLAAPVRASFGGFAAWRAGFATTVASRPTAVRVQRAGRRAAVTLVLLAADRSPGGVVRRRFMVRWALVATGRRWVAHAVTATRG